MTGRVVDLKLDSLPILRDQYWWFQFWCLHAHMRGRQRSSGVGRGYLAGPLEHYPLYEEGRSILFVLLYSIGAHVAARQFYMSHEHGVRLWRWHVVKIRLDIWLWTRMIVIWLSDCNLHSDKKNTQLNAISKNVAHCLSCNWRNQHTHGKLSNGFYWN